MATPIATGALKPKVAVGIAAILNLVGAFLSTEVATTISGGIINEGDDGVLDHPGAHLRGPHRRDRVEHGHLAARPALVVEPRALRRPHRRGASSGFGVQADRLQRRPLEGHPPALLAPLTAGLIAYTATKLAYAITRRYDGKPDGRDGFRHAQIFSSSLVALAHGTNDAQKTMGVITLTLVSAGLQPVGNEVRAVGHRRVRHRDRARHVHGRLAHHQDPRHRASPTSSPRRASPPRRPRPRRSSPPPTSASPSRPPRSPPAPSSGRASAAAARRCAGAPPAASASAGCSPSRRPASSAPSRRSSRTFGPSASSSTPSSASRSSSGIFLWSPPQRGLAVERRERGRRLRSRREDQAQSRSPSRR